MKRPVSPIALCVFCFLLASCKPEPTTEPTPLPVGITKVRFTQEATAGGYHIEIGIPWKGLSVVAKPGMELGLELFAIDDDDGGLGDMKIGWNTALDRRQIPVPADFGLIELHNEVTGTLSHQIPTVASHILIDGNKEEAWANAPSFDIAKAPNGLSPSAEDLSGSFQVLWDTVALYFFIHIKDDSSVVDSRSLAWEDDGIALYVDPHLSRQGELEEGKHFLYRLLRGQTELQENTFPFPVAWTIPVEEVFSGGPGKDGIPSIDNPQFVPANKGGFLRDNDLVIGVAIGEEARAYPHPILDWHEIINDQINGFEFAITYCPLTGTGIGWERVINGFPTTFGVSGLLYNTNLIPYDRYSNSNWSQMQLGCVEGSAQGLNVKTIPIVETTWKTWRTMFPETQVVSLETGFDRAYGVYPYGDYRTNDDALIFPINPDDSRLPRKERVHGIIDNTDAIVFPFSRFLGRTSLAHDAFKGRPIVVAGSSDWDFIVSFYRELEDGTVLAFSPVNDQDPSIIMRDQEDNLWNIVGQAVSGPRMGSQLSHTNSYIGYWFAFGAFFPEPQIK